MKARSYDMSSTRVIGPWILTWRSHQYIMNEGFSDPAAVNARLNELWDKGHPDARVSANPLNDGVIASVELKR